MTKTLKISLLFGVLLTFCSCAGTVQLTHSLSINQASPDKVTIKVSRPSWFGGALSVGIQDGTTVIGSMGGGGELSWHREPGYVAVIAIGSYGLPSHAVIFPVEAGKTYSLKTEMLIGGRFILKPENFPKKLIAYELKSEYVKVSISDSWKNELEQLSSQYESNKAMKAMVDKDRNVRRSAVKKIIDQTALAKFAVQDEDSEVRRAAVEKLTDQAVLAKIAVEDKESDVRRTAAKKIIDQTVLAKIAVQDEDSEVRRTAVEKLTDQAVLAKIAVEDKGVYVRRPAVQKLADQALLAKIAVQDQDSEVRLAAVEKLTDQAVLVKIAVEDKESDVRRTAVEKLTDQAVLAKIAVEDKGIFVRRAAVEKLTGQAVLAKIAVQDQDSEVRLAAVEKLTDQTLLTKIAVEDKNSIVRSAAVEKLIDQAVLTKFAVEEKDLIVRRVAIVKITDQSLLSKIARDKLEDVSVRNIAAKRLLEFIIGDYKIKDTPLSKIKNDLERSDLFSLKMLPGSFFEETSADGTKTSGFMTGGQTISHTTYGNVKTADGRKFHRTIITAGEIYFDDKQICELFFNNDILDTIKFQ